MAKLKIRLIIAGLVLVLIAGAFVAGGFILKRGAPPKPTISGTIIKDAIAEISELAVLRYHYTDMGKFEDPMMIKDWVIPLTTKSFVISYNGEIKLGLIFKDIEVDVNNLSKEIKITLPPVRVLSHTIDENSVQVWDQTKNIFNPIQIGDFMAFVMERKEIVEDFRVDEKLRNEAQESARKQIEAFVGNFAGVKDEYTVVFA